MHTGAVVEMRAIMSLNTVIDGLGRQKKHARSVVGAEVEHGHLGGIGLILGFVFHELE